MSNIFNDPFAANLVGLWDFLNSGPTADTGLADGFAQNGELEGGASVSGGRLHTDGHNDIFNVRGETDGGNDDAFDLSEGTIAVQFTQDQHVGTSDDTIVNRGEYADRGTEGYFEIRVGLHGTVELMHCANGEDVNISTPKDFFDPGDKLKVTYSWSETEGGTYLVENLTDGTQYSEQITTTGLTMDVGDNDDESWTFGARENDDGQYNHYFDGSIDYVAIYDKDIINTGPDGAVDGEEFGEVMELGYDDSNAPTNQGGDVITENADLIFGNGGDDTIDGEGGNDTIYGDDGEGGSVEGPRESFNWDLVSGHQADSTVTQDTGNVEVTYTRITDTGDHQSDIDNSTPLNTAGIDSGSETIDTNSSLDSETNGEGNTGAFQWEFSEPVGNLEFNINDLDGDGLVTVIAFDANGDPIEVVLQGGSDINVVGNTADAIGPYQDVNDPDTSVQISIAGPVSRVVVEHTQNGPNNSGINVTDMYFDTGFDPDQDGEGGDDVITGGDGADEIFGEGGDDTFIVSGSSDGDGDTIIGGNGPDDTLDNDTLDLRGTGQVTIVEAADATDAGGRTGTVTFADGATLEFSQIETILTDPQNEAPTANDDTVTVNEDETVTFDPTANDVDPDGDPLTVTNISDPANGTLTDNGDGTYTYEPDENYNGPDSVTYTVQDPSGETSTATVTFNVTPVNDAPDAMNDVATTDEEVAITLTPLDNDMDVDGDTLRITAATVPTEQGTVTFTDTEIEFTPADDFFGEATISYSITDDNGGTDTAEIAVTVNNINDAPVAVDDTVETMEDSPVTFNPADNDEDVDGDPLVVSAVDPIDPALGTVTLNPDGTVTLDPALNFNGPIEITYTVDDGQGGTDTGTALVNVGPVNDAPIAEDDDAGTTPQGTAIVIEPLVNDSDPDGDTIGIIAASVPASQGTVTFNDTEIEFTPAPAFVGEATISYTISDGNGLTDTADITVEVTDVIGPVDGTNNGQLMTPGFADAEGDQIDGADGDDDTIFGNGGNDTIDAGEGDDTVDGGADDDSITGGSGDDSVDGGEGSDTLAGGEGTDTLNGGEGDDDIAVGGDDEATGGTGDDVFTVDASDPAADLDASIDGGSDGTDGNPDGPENGDEGDILDLDDRPEDLTVVLEDADPENGTVNGLDADGTPDLTFEEIEKIVTGSGDDTIDGDDATGPIDVETGAGDDSVDGGDGDDMINTGPGNDTVDAGDGSDTVDGGNGDNLIDTSSDNALPLPDDGFPGYGPVPPVPADADPNDDRDLVTTGSGNDTITTGDDNDTINAGAGDNLIDAGIDDDEITTLFGDDTIVGGEGNDTISSGAGDDLIYGGLDPAAVPFDGTDIPDAPNGGSFGPDPDENNGRDFIEAGAGNDTVYGQDDDDTIFGGGGSDYLDGGVDDDSIVGGDGRDTILGGQGADTLEGNAGSDEFRFDEREHAFGDEIDGGTEDGDNDPATDNENDQLDLRGLGRFEIVQSDGTTPLDLTTPNDPDGNSFTGQINFLDENGAVEGTLNFTEIEQLIPCFTPGTVIATPQGERLVEELREGDRIITRDNGLQEIRWVGRRDLSGQELLNAPHLQPVLIRAGSLGHGLPERDMMVSPQHRLLINSEKAALYFEDREVLAAAKHLTGMDGVASVEASSVSYIHFMFDQHEVVLSNGAWTESFQPGDTVLDGMGEAQRNEIFDLFPDLAGTDGLNAYTAARRSLKKHEARLLVK